MRFVVSAVLIFLAATPWAHAASWFEGSHFSPQALVLLQALRGADEWGLNPKDYRLEDIPAAASEAALAPERIAQVNLEISNAAWLFIQHLHYGRVNPRTVGFDMPPRPRLFDAPATLEQLATAKDVRGVIASLEPPFKHYALLKTQLAAYRKLALQPRLTQLPPLNAKSIEPGRNYAGAPALRELLVALGDLSSTAQATDTNLTLDPQLVEALRRFQFRHGLTQDGVLGKRVYATLTAPLSNRVRQIELTLERWRWLPALNSPTIIVNIPQFRLFAFESNSDREDQMLTMDVIVGQTYPHTRTPVFAADMKYVIFQPYWDVPYNIMSRELLPHIRTDPAYLAKNDFEIVGAGPQPATQNPTPQQLADLATGKLRVRQRPGERNALGPVKFMLPNSYNVYLHSTPAHELFRQSRRAFSHGCIRVSNPAGLAEYVLRNAPTPWSREQIDAALSNPVSQRVDLKQPVRVLIVYGTAVATEAGRVYFFDDLYGNDAQLAKVLKD